MPTMANGHEAKFAKISTGDSGDTALVAAVTGKKIKVTGMFLIAAGAVSVKFKGGATDLTGAMAVAANGGFSVMSNADNPIFETAAGAALNINLSGAVAVAGAITYIAEE